MNDFSATAIDDDFENQFDGLRKILTIQVVLPDAAASTTTYEPDPSNVLTVALQWAEGMK